MIATYLRWYSWHALRIYVILTQLGSTPVRRSMGTAMPSLTLEGEYWGLVHQLMIHGWYRVGQGSTDDHQRTHWGFQEGHLRDVPSSAPLWIPARDECAAMHILLREIERAVADRASRATYAATASRSAPGMPGGPEAASQNLAMP
jgi:hypothetical protein